MFENDSDVCITGNLSPANCLRYLLILGTAAGMVTSVSQPMNPYEGGQVRGGGGGNKKLPQKTIRGNSTGMNMVSSR